MMLQTKENYIEFFRKNGFNCFPIPEMQKVADIRYQASRTKTDQRIDAKENYGLIPIMGTGTAIVDFDNKERYRKFAETTMKAGFMVIETGMGWHVPIINLSGEISKIELFDYEYQKQKIVEIQGPNHYCVGAGSMIFHDKLNEYVTYQNKGGEKIWDAGGNDFHDFIDQLCKQLGVVASKEIYRSRYKDYRDRFLKGLTPTKGTSNNYFRMAALQCNTEGLTQDEAIEKIKIVYDEWSSSKTFSGRPWANITRKITEVYEKNETIEKGRPPGSKFDPTVIAQTMIKERKLYSDVDTHEIFENRNGFLEMINNTLVREIALDYPEIDKENYNKILFTLEALAEPMPTTNKNFVVFKNGVYDRKAKILTETDEIADVGFKDYNYLPTRPENNPTRFIESMLGNIPEQEHPRAKAGLRSVMTSYLDPKISIVYGASGVGKSTPLSILVRILGQYAMSVELVQLLEDKFIKAKIKGKLLLVIQDLPPFWKDFSQIKTMTGEKLKTERGFMQDSTMFENKLKVFATGNYLAKIPDREKDPMYSRRLSLLHNTRTEAYEENPTIEEDIVKDEGEKIISWILNLQDEECKYENARTVRIEWEKLSSPEEEYIENNWEVYYAEGGVKPQTTVKALVNDLKKKTSKDIAIVTMRKSLENQGYVIKYNVIQNIREKKQTSLTGLDV